MSTTPVEDPFGRPVKNLRVSLTGRCNLNCVYCHGEGRRSDPGPEVSGEEVVEVVEVALSRGVEKVKLTGGEPLLREDLEWIIGEISPGLRDISITTNGTLLEDRADPLAEAGLDRVNVSLDSLDPSTYREVTGGGDVEEVLGGIDAAVEADLNPVKVNVVALRGLNDDGFEEMIRFARNRGVILQLIELLDTGRPYFEKYHHDLLELEDELKRRADRVEKREMHKRAKYFVDGTEVEVVRPIDNTEFCRNCTRLRFTSDGKFKPCLMREDNLVDADGDVETAFNEAVLRREPFYC